MKYFQKKNFQVFFFQNFGPPIMGYDPSGKHDPLFKTKPFFKKISGENFIPKFWNF